MTERTEFKLVPFSEEHIENTVRWRNDPAIKEAMGIAGETTPEGMRAWLRKSLAAGSARMYAVVSGGGHVGNIWYSRIDRAANSAEIRILLGESSARGRGLGRKAVEEALRLGKETLGLKQVTARIFTSNRPSLDCFRGCGFAVQETRPEFEPAFAREVETAFLARAL